MQAGVGARFRLDGTTLVSTDNVDEIVRGSSHPSLLAIVPSQDSPNGRM